MKTKTKILALSLLSLVMIAGCGKKDNGNDDSSSSFYEEPYEAKEVEVKDYATACMKGSGNIYTNGKLFVSTSTFIKNPAILDGKNQFKNVIKTCPIGQLKDKMVIYTPDYWKRTTSVREDEFVTEFVVRQTGTKIVDGATVGTFEVVEEVTSDETIIPVDGIVISMPLGYDAKSSISVGDEVTFDNFTFSTYSAAVYSESGRRVPVAAINPRYVNTWAGANLYDVSADTSIVHGNYTKYNTVLFDYNAEQGAYNVKEVDQKTYFHDLKVPTDGFLLVNSASADNTSSLLLEENVIFNKNEKVYMETPVGLFENTIKYKIGYQGTTETGVVGPNVEVLTTDKVNNEWGYEISVTDGKVTGHGVNMPHPTNGYRIRFSGYSDPIEYHIASLRDQFKIGTQVSYSSKDITVTHNLKDIAPTYLQHLSDEIDGYIAKRETDLYDFDVNKVKTLKDEFNTVVTEINGLPTATTTQQYYYQNRVNYAKHLHDEAYLSAVSTQPVETRSVWHYPLSDKNDLNGVKATINQLKNAGFNEVIVSGSIDEVGNYGVVYKSKYAATAPSLVGKYGKYSDYLHAFVSEAHKVGLKVQVTMSNWFFYNAIIDRNPEFANYFATNMDGTEGVHGNGEITKFLDPANETVRNLYLSMYKEIIDKYKIDGFHLDYIRYGAGNDTPAETSQGYTLAAMNGFINKYPVYGHITSLDVFKDQLKNNSLMYSQFCEYRAGVITDFVGQVRELAKGKQMTIAVVSNATIAKNSKLQDWKTWVEKNYIDSIHLMAYYLDQGYVRKDSLEALDHANGNAYVVTGISPIYSNLEIMEVATQFEAARATGVQGTALFASHSFGNRPDLEKFLNDGNGKGVYNTSAIVAYSSAADVSKAFANTIKSRITNIYKPSSLMNDSQEAALIADLDKLVKAANPYQEVTNMLQSANSGAYGSGAVKDRLIETLSYAQGIYQIKGAKI